MSLNLHSQCRDNVLSEKLCPDGMAFNDLNPKVEKCDFLYQVECGERAKLRECYGTVHGFTEIL